MSSADDMYKKTISRAYGLDEGDVERMIEGRQRRQQGIPYGESADVGYGQLPLSSEVERERMNRERQHIQQGARFDIDFWTALKFGFAFGLGMFLVAPFISVIIVLITLSLFGIAIF